MNSRILGLIAALLSAGPALAAVPQAPSPMLAQAFEDAQMAGTSRAGAALARSAARLASRDPALAALVARREDAEARWRGVDERRLRALGRTSETAQEQSAALARMEQSLTDELAGLDAELASRFPAYVEITSAAPVSLAGVQALLQPDEALVLVLPSSQATYVWAVRRDRAAWIRSDLGEAEMAAVVSRLRRALDPSGALRAGVDASGGSRTAPEAFPRAEAFGLYQKIWAPLEPVIGRAKTVYVAASGPLSSLPFAVLPTAAPRGQDGDPAALRATPWLFRKHALATLPAVSSLRALRGQQAHAEGARPFAGYGDPALQGAPGEPLRGAEGYADVSAIKGMARLPGSRTELESLARTLGAPPEAVVTGAAATETAVRSAPLADVRVVAFATHGLLAGEIGGLTEPALVLTPPDRPGEADDGLLTASEAAGLRLSADWVVLSACNTAAGDGRGGVAFGGEGLSGLARGFFYAGARALLVSHWRVRDDAAARLTSETLKAYARRPQAGRAEALRHAMNDLLQDRRDPSLAQPSAWAAFVLAGEDR